MIKINKKSIAVKLSIVMLIVIIAQALLLIGSVWASGVISSLRDNAYSSLSEKVENRKDYLQNEMNLRFSNIASYAYEIASIYDQISTVGSGLKEGDITPFLMQSSPKLIDMIRSTMTTGSFLILDNNGKNDTYSAIYFKDEDPSSNNESNNDIYMLKGPVDVSRKLQTPLHSTWNYGLTLNETNRDIFSKPFEAASKSDNLKLLGYWHVAPNMGGNGISMVTYSLPLISKNGEVFGVLGVEISQDQFYKMLPPNELFENSSLGYILAIHHADTGKTVPVLIQGSVQKTIVNHGAPLELQVQNKKQNVYKIINSSTQFPVHCQMQELKLYNNNTPFENEQWTLIGLVEEDNLLKFSENFIRTLSVAFFASIVLGSVIVFLVGINFTEPVVALAKKVRINDPKTVVSLGRTGLSEIDDLSIAIEGLNQNILDVVLKTDKIIHMVNLPLGTFEYHKGSDFVICSATLFEILGISVENTDSGSINSRSFFEKIESIQERVEDEKNKIYMLSDDPAKWIKIVSIEHENSVLGVVMDVTREVLDSHVMKFELDYDGLTNLFNRFAFRRSVEQIFQNGVELVSAFVMFDLDNLKYINDTYGHDIGDIYIKSTAEILAYTLQDRCVVGRMSGDEFYVFLHGFETKDEIRDLLKTVYNSFDYNQLTLPNGNAFKIRMSGGLAWYGEDSYSLDELIRFSDFAMYQGKHTIKGEIREFNKEAYTNETFMLSGREELNKVLDSQLIEYAFQPIISAKTGELYAYESLMRPQSEVLPSPLKLIQIATAQSKLWQIEKITFFKTLSLYMKYSNLFNGCKIFINSVPNQILKESEYMELELLYGDALDKVVIEIIENEKLDAKTLEKKRALVQKWGGAIALDDYGAGYNGDISLLSISPQIVKIDRLMIEGIETDRNRQSIVQKLLVYAREQGIIVLAEGVETYGQMEYLVRIGVDLLQGYYIARPSFIPDFNSEVIAKEIESINQQKAY